MIGMNLTGGGARGSYQAGVIRGLMEIADDLGLLANGNPFKFWSGASAGSINATFCAAGMENPRETGRQLAKLWESITPNQVYHTDMKSLGANSIKWLRDLTFGSLADRKLARSLLNTKPLWKLIEKNVNFGLIEKNITTGLIDGLACSAYNYQNHATVTFLQSRDRQGWKKLSRYSVATAIKPEHVVASCAIPILFPSVKIDEEYFGDGSFRNTSPISSVIQMGARKILIVGVRGINEMPHRLTESERLHVQEPTIARIAGLILNALFFDTIDIDLERVSHINEIIATLRKDLVTNRSEYSAIDYKVIRPSQDIAQLAAHNLKHFPKFLEFLMSGLGSTEDLAILASYILFTPEFTGELLSLGYRDIMAQKDEIAGWLKEPLA